MTEALRQRLTGIAFLLLLVVFLIPWILSSLEIKNSPSVAITVADDVSLISSKHPSINLSPEQNSSNASTEIQVSESSSAPLELHQKTKAQVIPSVVKEIEKPLWRSQIASFINPQNAENLCKRMNAKGQPCSIEKKSAWYRVYLGPLDDKIACKTLASQLAKRHYSPIEQVNT